MPVVVDPGYSDIYSDIYEPSTAEAAVLYVESEFVSGTWTDISIGHEVRSVSTRRGRSNESDSFSAGTATVTLDNRERDFDPSYVDSPYYPNVKPNRRVRVSMYWAGTLYYLFTGYVDSWPQEFVNPSDGFVPLSLTDGFKILAKSENPHPILQLDDEEVGFLDKCLLGELSDELTGARIATTLANVDWSATALDGGRTILPAGQAKGPVLAYLQAVASSEEGRLFIAGNGDVVFLDRHAPFLNERSSTSQATFGDGAGELRYSNITFDYSDDQIRNDVSIRMPDDTGDRNAEISVEDADSIAEYLRLSFAKDVLYTDARVAQGHAEYILSRYKDPMLRVASITIKPWRDPDNLIPQVLGREIGDRITVKRRPQGVGDPIVSESLIEAVSHAFSPSGTWTVTWSLSPVDTANYLILDSAEFGLLDTARVGF